MERTGKVMTASSTAQAFDLIGFCLAPLTEDRRGWLETAAKKVSDWEEPVRLACNCYIGQLVFARLRSAGLLDLVPPEVRDRLQVLYLQTAALNALRLRQMLELSSRLSARGVRTLYLKGTSLIIAGDYPDPAQRMFADVDVLVAEAHRAAVRQVFAESGEWHELPPYSAGDTYQTVWLNRWRTLIEVHWRMGTVNEVPNRVAEERLWSRAVEVNYRGHRAWIPSPEDRFIQAAVHGTAWHPFNSSFLYMAFADLAHLAGKPEQPLDWAWIGRALERERILEHAAVATELGWEFTRFPSLAEGLRVFRTQAPGMQKITEPLIWSLSRMVRKPWAFSSWSLNRFLTDQRPCGWARILGRTVYYKLFPGARKVITFPEEIVEIRTVLIIKPYRRYRRLLLEWDFLWYVVQLSRFYRRIRYAGMNRTEREDGNQD